MYNVRRIVNAAIPLSSTGSADKFGVCEVIPWFWLTYWLVAEWRTTYERKTKDNKFYFFEEKATWYEHETKCQEKGLRVAEIQSDDDLNSLNELLDDFPFAWIGASDRFTEGTWKWQHSNTPVVNFWRSGEPNNSGGEDCGELNRGTMIDYKCDRR